MKEETNNRKWSKSRKCSIYNCSLIKRAKMARTGRDDLKAGQPHPDMDHLVFVCYNRRGNEEWKTLNEIDETVVRKAGYHQERQSSKQLALAAERKAHSKKLDEEAADLIKFHEVRGIELKAFRKLKKSIQKRLLEASPDIVIKSDDDREARQNTVLDSLAEDRKIAAEKMRQDMQAKLARARALYSTMDIVETVSMAEIEAENKKRKPITQSDLNELSNSRYDVPECLSEYAQLEEEFTDETY